MDATRLSAPVSFLYMVLRAEGKTPDQGGAVTVAEFGYGTEPAAPDNWVPMPLSELLVLVLDDLGQEG
jgi:hypothetical protein